MYGPKPLTVQQRALLDRFGLRGVAAHNQPIIQQYYAREPAGSNASRAVQLARAMASGAFGRQARGQRRQAAVARAATPAALKRLPAVAQLQRRWRREKIQFNQAEARLRNQKRNPKRRGGGLNTQDALLKVRANRTQRLAATTAELWRARMAAAKGGKRRGAGWLRSHQLKGTRWLRDKDNVPRKQRLKWMVSSLWDVGQQVAQLMTPPSSLEQKLYAVLDAQLAGLAVDGVLRKEKRMVQGATMVKAAMGTLTTWAMRRGVTALSCAVGAPGVATSALVSYALFPISMAIGSKTYIAVEESWNAAVDDIIQASARVRGPKALAMITRLLDAADKLRVPECVRTSLLARWIRDLLNLKLRELVGYELDYAMITKILVRHKNALRMFLLGEPANLKPLVMDAVDVVPDAQIDSIINNLNSQFGRMINRNRPMAKSS